MNNYNQIDLDRVKEKVAHFASIDDSKTFIINEEVSFNPLIINRNINETKELLDLINKDINISFDGIFNIDYLFIQSKKGICLNSNELSDVLNFHNHCERIKNILNSYEDDLSIKDYSDSIYLDKTMANEINKVVDNNGIIKDDASKKLSDIINKININENRLIDKANDFISKHNSNLQEATIYERNNRICFLFKNSDKNKFNGYAYGTSASGIATYVEPEIFIDLNNTRASLKNDKDSEIKRILEHLTYLISLNADSYINNFDSILKLNVVYAKAKYGYENNGILASLDNDLHLKDIAHPLIEKNKVILNTYSLKRPYKGIVISGTNTGGKTVGLKCIGLSCLMTYLGIPIIADEAKIPLYDNIFVDIDDNQSIFNSLSTFSAHISNINNILKNATNNSLILIDELISGTDPKEAQAISLAILNNIEEIGSYYVITTHYDDIKNYAFNNENILLSAVGFDYEKLKPTYKYIENAVGSSNALDIAERYFDNKELIKYARSIVNNNSSKEEELMHKLEKEIETNEKLNNDLIFNINKKIKLEDELNNKIIEFDNNKEKLIHDYENKLNDYIEEIKEKANQKLDSIKDKNDIDIVKEIDNLKIDNIQSENIVYEIGDNVKVGTNDAIGNILEIKGDRVIVNLKGILIKTDVNNLTKMPKTVKIATKASFDKPKTIKKELNIVGKHIDEAIVDLECFLDEAQLNRLSQVKIIHGVGTGQLRNAVHNKLKSLKFVKNFGYGDYHDGGQAVTMVNLK